MTALATIGWFIATVTCIPPAYPAGSYFRHAAPMSPAPYPVTVEPAATIYPTLLKEAGVKARLNHLGQWVLNRDAVDRRILWDVLHGTGQRAFREGNRVHYLDPQQLGGYPTMRPGRFYADDDHDGRGGRLRSGQ